MCDYNNNITVISIHLCQSCHTMFVDKCIHRYCVITHVCTIFCLVYNEYIVHLLTYISS